MNAQTIMNNGLLGTTFDNEESKVAVEKLGLSIKNKLTLIVGIMFMVIVFKQLLEWMKILKT